MKILRLSLVLLGGVLPTRGQEGTALQSDAEVIDSTTNGTPSEPATELEPTNRPAATDEAHLLKSTFIPHSLEVKPFTPPPPPVVKRLPAVRVDAAISHRSQNSRTITLQRGEASTEPDLPPPLPSMPYVKPGDPTPEQIARRIWHHHNLNFGATIYDHKTSVVSWTDQESLVRYEAVCGFDIGLLAGVGGFVHSGENYNFFLMHSHFDTTWERRLTRRWQLNIPEVAPGDIRFTKGDVEDVAATASINIIKEIIAAETPRLLTFQAERRTYFAASAAWHAANPPIPRDETFILRPHRGSHYLSDAKPAKPAQ